MILARYASADAKYTHVNKHLYNANLIKYLHSMHTYNSLKNKSGSRSGSFHSKLRVVARIRPPQHKDLDQDIIISTISNGFNASYPTDVKIPNPRNEKESFTFSFSSVYDHLKTQQELFENEADSVTF